MLSGAKNVLPFERHKREAAPGLGGDRLIACVDGSGHLAGVCEHAAWLCTRLQSSMEILHVEEPAWTQQGAQIAAVCDEPLSMERGPKPKSDDPILDEAADRLGEIGVQPGQFCWARGRFAPIAASLAAGAEILVMGRRGERHEDCAGCFGDNVSQMIRLCPAPVLLASRTFLPIARALVICDPASDAPALSAFLASSPILDGLSMELVGAVAGAHEANEAANDGAAPAQPPQSLEEHLTEDPYDLVVVSRRAFQDPAGPDELSPLARQLMDWRISLLVY